MGSFTEVSLSFNFVESTPDHVLAAFSKLWTGETFTDYSHPAPPLPEPVVEAWEDFVPDWREYLGPTADPFEHEPWRHDWAAAVTLDMGPTNTHGHLSWNPYAEHWNLDCRFSWKTHPIEASEAISWLAPFVEPCPGFYSFGVVKPGTREFEWIPNPTLVGYALYEGEPRPHLFWVKDGAWELEDLNSDDLMR